MRENFEMRAEPHKENSSFSDKQTQANDKIFPRLKNKIGETARALMLVSAGLATSGIEHKAQAAQPEQTSKTDSETVKFDESNLTKEGKWAKITIKLLDNGLRQIKEKDPEKTKAVIDQAYKTILFEFYNLKNTKPENYHLSRTDDDIRAISTAARHTLDMMEKAKNDFAIEIPDVTRRNLETIIKKCDLYLTDDYKEKIKKLKKMINEGTE